MYSKRASKACYIGLTQWQHSAWQDGPLLRGSNTHVLNAYSKHFSSVEGNTTFYGLPKAETVKLWFRETPEHFRFCFKFPQKITHDNQLRLSSQETTEFLNRLQPLKEKTGLLCIQLPASFSAQELSVLEAYLKTLPKEFSYGIEVRHLDFFDKNEKEKQFNRLLADYSINRISFDTRALFAHPADDEISLKAKSHKPDLPVHAISTAQYPMIRFITPMDWQWGTTYLDPWLAKAEQWINAGKQPYFFFHTPDNADAPDLAAYFVNQLQQRIPDICLFAQWESVTTEQNCLF
ncbi:DUF72 domain-containing protein [Neptuniibacter sp.]|uniref:DUF72 domain-containing protein n=1 Tax=Neptuniibacter sp. TaxID=1962643 RepID=UPI0026024B88|nr:DUF72 domain-containing protein [Neptuniibacter sp.]MCP4597251.1 DUF72 domain-containing protein [Neptuniibacter sp.]